MIIKDIKGFVLMLFLKRDNQVWFDFRRRKSKGIRAGCMELWQRSCLSMELIESRNPVRKYIWLCLSFQSDASSSSWKIMVTPQISFPMALETQMCLGEGKKYVPFFLLCFHYIEVTLYDDPTCDLVRKFSILIRQFSYFKTLNSYTIVVCIIWRKWHFYKPVLFDYSGIS